MLRRFRPGLNSMGTTIARTFDFSGRSRRTEVAWFWIYSLLAGLVLRLLPDPPFVFQHKLYVELTVEFFIMSPFFALFARRLHDQNRSAWWALILFPTMAASTYRHLQVSLHAFDPNWPDLGYWQLIAALLIICVFGFVLMEGTDGANRFGLDPRAD